MSKRRTLSKQIRFNSDELMKLEALCTAYGMDYSSFIRQLIAREYDRLQQLPIDAGGEFRPTGQPYPGVRMRPLSVPLEKGS